MRWRFCSIITAACAPSRTDGVGPSAVGEVSDHQLPVDLLNRQYHLGFRILVFLHMDEGAVVSTVGVEGHLPIRALGSPDGGTHDVTYAVAPDGNDRPAHLVLPLHSGGIAAFNAMDVGRMPGAGQLPPPVVKRLLASTRRSCLGEDLGAVIDPRDMCLLYTSPSPRDGLLSRMPSSA